MTTRATKIQAGASCRAASRLALAGLLLSLAGLPAGAVPQIESTYGGQSPWYTAELNALSVSGVAQYRGGMSTILNPAGLAGAAVPRLDLGLNASHHEEDRFQPLYDSFESLVDDVAIASNQNTWWGYGFAGALPLIAAPLPVSVGVSLADRYPFAYRFEEELRDPDVFSDPRDRILEERLYEVTGTLRQLSLGLGAGLFDWLDAGVSLHYAFGERTERKTVRDNALGDGDQSYDDQDDWDLSGTNLSIGLQAQPHQRVRLGLAYETRLTVDGDHASSAFAAGDSAATVLTGEESLRYPAYWRFGGAFYPRSDPRTVFSVDVIYADWSELEDSRWGADGDRPFLQEVWDVRLGLQHTFYNGTDLRFGFRRYDSYADPEGGNSVFGAGVGFPVLAGQLSVSLELNKLQSRLGHIFGYPEDFVAEATARVDDLHVRLGLGWKREF